ncbi:hypothetical protein SAMN06265360_1497, partial [Haloechinothrix alba]
RQLHSTPGGLHPSTTPDRVVTTPQPTCLDITAYSAKISAGITAGTNDFVILYHIITGVHFFQVGVGTGVLVGLIVSSRRDA